MSFISNDDLLHCLSFLPLPSLPTCMIICKDWESLINTSEMLWQELLDAYKRELKRNPKQVFNDFNTMKDLEAHLYELKHLNGLDDMFEESIKKNGLLNDSGIDEMVLVKGNRIKNEVVKFVGRIHAHSWRVALIPDKKRLHRKYIFFDDSASRLGNMVTYEIIRKLGLVEKFFISYKLDEGGFEHFKPLFQFKTFCDIATSKMRNEEKSISMIEDRERLFGIYFKEGRNIIFPDNLIDNEDFQEMVYTLFVDLTRFSVVQTAFGSKWPIGESEKNLLFAAFLNSLSTQLIDNLVTLSNLSQKIDQFIGLLSIEKCDHLSFQQLIEGRWFGKVVELFKKYQYLIDKKHVYRLFQSAYSATDYPELVKYLMEEYLINPLDFYDERNIIAQYFDNILEKKDTSLRYILDPLLDHLGLKKLNLELFCKRCKENNYPNLSSVEQVFNIMDSLVQSSPHYVFVSLVSSMNVLFEPQMVFKHSIIFNKVLEFYNEGKSQSQPTIFEELVHKTKIISEYSEVKYDSLKEMMFQERDYNPQFGELLELCEQIISENALILTD